MAASNITAVVTLPGGATSNLSIYLPTSAAAGIYLPNAKSSIAASTDSVDLVVKQTVMITDISTVATAGVVQLWENGEPRPVMVDLSNHLNTNPARPRLGISLRAGSTYRFKVLSALSA